MKPTFFHGADGEYCRCPHCERKGYGIDSLHPVTSEFWAVELGRLILSQCLACRSEARHGRKGMVV